MQAEPAILVDQLVKVYKSTRAVDGISFALEQGSITGLLGGNGAGKTTTLAMILGLITPTSGAVRVLGAHMPRQRYQVLHKLNFGIFGQMIIIPLLRDHRILTQVAGYHTEVIKFLPPLTITREDLDWFLGAMTSVLAQTQRFPGAAWDTVAGLAKRAVMA